MLKLISHRSRFASIAWSEMAQQSSDYSHGLIAGGMIDGTINLWNPHFLSAEGDGDEALIGSIAQHQGAVHGLQFNPHKESSHLLGTGGADGEVYVMALDRPDTPNVFVPAPPPSQSHHTGEITRVAWNTQVAHILASSAQNGQCIIWDLRQKKAWCELRDPMGGAIADIAWNPDQGLNFVTAGGDDKNPVIKLWDLRSSTSLPLATLQGHTEGVLSVSWCPSDTSLLLSCGKDNRTLLWDLFHLQVAYELPTAGSSLRSPSCDGGFGGGSGGGDASSVFGGGAQQDTSMFGGLASAAGSRRYEVDWSPCMPAVISACSFDRSVQFYSLSGAKSKLGRAPKWLRKPVGASFGFGGKLVSFDNKPHPGEAAPAPAAGGKSRANNGSVRMRVAQVIDNPSLAAACDSFHVALSAGNLKELCEQKAATATDPHEAQIWTLMKIICFEKNAREMLLAHLGFDAPAIEAAAQAYVASRAASSPAGAHAADVSGSAGADGVTSGAPATGDTMSSWDTSSGSGSGGGGGGVTQEQYEAAEGAIRDALVVGNFAAAVDCCVEAGMMAEALLLAQCGEPELWTKTQNIFFERFRAKRPFLNILHAVINSELMGLVMASDLSRWRETLAIVNTYGKSEEFGQLCESLAGRLVEEGRDTASATLCYMCANNVPRAISHWVEELKSANAAAGCMDTVALQTFVEKVVVYVEANKAADEAGAERMVASSRSADIASLQVSVPECSEFFAAYASMLASQGRLDLAPGYLRGETQDECILRDRVYHAGGPKRAGSRPPQFPFARVNVASTQQQAGGNHIPSVVTAASKAQPSGAQRQTTASPSQAGLGQSSKGSFGAAQSPQQQQAANPAAGFSPQPAAAAAPDAAGGLPAGWLQLADPGSGRPYYVNQATGQSQWEPPLPQPAQLLQPSVSSAQANHIPSATAASQQPQQPVQQQAAAAMPAAVAVAAAAMSVSAAPATAAAAAATSSSSDAPSFMASLDQIVQGLLGECAALHTPRIVIPLPLLLLCTM
jgi:protein transport protein SEC31